MVKVIRQGVYYMNGRLVKESEAFMTSDKKEIAVKNTIAYGILSSHNTGEEDWQLKPDAVLLFDQADVLRTLDFIKFREFPCPTYLFHDFYLGEFYRSAAKKWGGEFVPYGLAELSNYALERVAKSGQLLFDSEGSSCGALGAMTLWMTEGELLRTFTNERFLKPHSDLLALFLKGKLRKGVGPTDVALAIMRALQNAGDYAEGKILEIFGASASQLSMDYRTALDNALSGTLCLATVWATDDKTREYFEAHLRGGDFKALSPVQPAYYDGAVIVDLSDIEPMIGIEDKIMPVKEFLKDPPERYLQNGRVFLGSASIRGNAVTYETMAEVAEILRGKQLGDTACAWSAESSRGVELALSENGYLDALLRAGLGGLPFGANRGLNAADGIECVGDDYALLDARTIAWSLANGGELTSALDCDYSKRFKKFRFDPTLYQSRIFSCIGKPQREEPLAYDEFIAPLPSFPPMPETLTLSVNGEEGALAITLDPEEEYAWSEAIEDRERGVCAALAKTFPEWLRTHLIDWGILPLTYEKFAFKEGDVLRLEGVAAWIKSGEERIVAKVIGKRRTKDIVLSVGMLNDQERKTLLLGGKNNLIRGK